MNATAKITTWTIDADADPTTTETPAGMTERAYRDVTSAIVTSRAMGCIGAKSIVHDADGMERTYSALRGEGSELAVYTVTLMGERVEKACTCTADHGATRPEPGQGPWFCNNCGLAKTDAVTPAKVARPRMEGHYSREVDTTSPRMFLNLLDAAEALEARRGPHYYRLVQIARKVVTAKASVPQYDEAKAKAEAQGYNAELVETFTTGRLLALHAAADYARAVTIMLGGDDAKLAPVDMEAVATYLVMLADARGF